MRKRITFAMAMLAFAIATQAQDRLKLATDKVLTKAEVRAKMPQKEMNSKFGRELQQLLGTRKVQTLSKKVVNDAVKEQKTVNVMVMMVPSAGVTAEMLENAGCKVNWSMKSQAFVTAPIDKLDEIAEINGVLGINLPEIYQLNNNIAREETNVSTVVDPILAEKAGLPQAYDGSGVIVGVVDSGIDFSHPAFRNADGTTRIKCAFTYRRTDTIEDDEPEKNWKNTYTDPEEILEVTPVTNNTHGSHTLGTAAGSNTGNDMQGMAPGADLVPADLIDLSYTYIISALKSICEYAEEVEKPVVVNYSLGSPGTFRDGCHPASQAIIELTDDGTKPGVIFSMSAGNEGDSNNYVHHTFTSDDEKLYVMMDVVSKTVEVDTGEEKVQTHPLHTTETLAGYADRLVDNEGEMLTAYSLSEKRIIDGGEKIGFATIYKEEMEDGAFEYYITDGIGRERIGLMRITLDVLRELLEKEKYYWQYVHRCSDGVTIKRHIEFETNKEMEILLFDDIRLGGCFSMPAGTKLSVMYRIGNRGGELIKPEGFDFVCAGTPDGCINDNVCNMANVTVGAYNVRNKYTTYFGETISFDKSNPIDEVSDFSSYGYTNDGNNIPKPDVLAPGGFILSAVNSNYASYFETYGNPLPKDKMTSSKSLAQKIEYNGKNYWYEYMEGTSMSTPVVTGIIALWLQAEPTLSVREIRDVLAHSAVPYKGSDPVKSSFYGKIDALAGLKYILSSTGIKNINVESQRPAKRLDSNGRIIIEKDGRIYNVVGSPLGN